MNTEYREQVKLLLDVMPYVAEEKQLALHGGTAINLFVRDMPRLSVDIDLTYIPVEDRETTLSNIRDILLRLKKRIEGNLVGSSVQAKPAIGKLLISNEKATIKLEINLVGRGVFDNIEKVALCNSAQEAYDTFVEIDMVPLAQLFGGKICAALDRQHPRDLFDVKYLLETEGISDEIKRGFMYCLLGSERPIYEVLNPHRLDQKEALVNQFDGMTDVLFTYEDYESTREKLINEIQASLTNSDIDFLIGFKSLEPDWSIYSYEQYPSIRWKLLNIQKLRDKNPEKYNEQVNRLKEFLDQIRP
ncbi:MULTISPECIES: nucleotidyl transferase AbiEii/AbiGii toxin family protein [Sphingobacterium]|uniref:nucleotidyl transferase AbiEii/AbiGii toxin family protein n=1 Tax=Sphingobacterium TaxID=28453 RepID=UPI00257D7626|nr:MULTISPECIES: nucleotidyl transferase AbiEii/AbiGii toxin family protein [Sphingobacterium]